MSSDNRTYQLRVAGHLDDRWSTWFGDLTIASHDDGTCTLTGPVADQAQLHGVLARLRDIGATLVSLHALDGDDDLAAEGCSGGSSSGQQTQLAAAAHGGAAVVDVELGVDALGVRAQCVERHEQMSGDLGAIEVGGEELENLQLARAQHPDQSVGP